MGAPNFSADDDQLVTKLDGDEAQQVFEELSKEPKYNQLKKRVTERGETLLPDDATMIRVDGEEKGILADVPITNTDADEAHLAIGRNTKSGEIIAAALEYDEEQRNGKEIKKTTLDATIVHHRLKREYRQSILIFLTNAEMPPCQQPLVC